jgi:molybdate/tungstate transport system substrate-binding protein
MAPSRRSVLQGLGGMAGLGTLGAVTYRTTTARDPPKRAEALVAGSLLRLAENIPGAVVEAHGSAAVRRMIRNDIPAPDAVVLADPRLFSGISARATLFATNALVLTYAPDSKYASALRQNWQQAVRRDGIRLGRTDPQLDPSDTGPSWRSS